MKDHIRHVKVSLRRIPARQRGHAEIVREEYVHTKYRGYYGSRNIRFHNPTRPREMDNRRSLLNRLGRV